MVVMMMVVVIVLWYSMVMALVVCPNLKRIVNLLPSSTTYQIIGMF